MSRGPVLVAGGAGFVGSWTVRALLEEGREVAVLDPGGGPLPPEARRIRGPADDAARIGALLREAGAEAAVGLAAFGAGGRGLLRAAEADPRAALAANAGSLAALLAGAAEAGVRRVVWASSTAVLPDGPAAAPGGDGLGEDAPADPRTVYGMTKAAAELVASWYRARGGVEPCGVRLPVVVGPGLAYRGAAAAFVDLARAAAAGTPAAVDDPDLPADVLYAKDAGRLLARLAGHPGPLARLYHAPSFRLRPSGFAAVLARLRPGVRLEVRAAGEGRAWPRMSDARLRADTGFAPRYDDAESMAADWLDELAGRERGS